MSGAAAAMAGARSATKVQPMDTTEDMTEAEQKKQHSKEKKSLRRKATVLKGMKDMEESIPPQDTVRAKFRICCESPMSSTGAMIFHTVFGAVIMMSLVFMTGETLNHDGILFPENLKPHEYKLMEILFTVLFTVDLVFRFCVADRFLIKRRYPDHLESHLPFFRDVLNWFDFLSILPLPIDTIVSSVYKGVPIPKYIRLLSVFRVLRIFKVTRHFEGTQIIIQTAQNSAAPIVVSCFMLISFMFVVSPILFFVEPCQIKDECVFQDAFNSMYYLMITLTTVGYGDQIPATAAGKTVGVLMMLSGALYMAMPLAIIGTKFDEAYQKHESEKLLKNKKWAENQMRRLQNVTRRTRKKRALHLGYQIAEEVGELDDWEATWGPQRKNTEQKGPLPGSEEEQAKHELLGDLFEDSGALAIDLNVLFGLNYHETMAADLAERKAKTDDGVSLGGAFWTSDDPFSKKKDELSVEEKRALDLVEKGKAEIAEMHNQNSDYLKTVSDANNTETCRDRVWLCTEVPKSSSCGFIYHWFSLGMTLLSILLFLAETTPDFNDYREGGRVCKQIVKFHCKTIYNKYHDAKSLELRTEAYLSNLGCWSSDFQWEGLDLNISTPTYQEQTDATSVPSEVKEKKYGGCFSKNDIKTKELDEKCHWPAPEIGYTCDEQLRWNSLTEGTTNKRIRSKEETDEKLYITTWKNPFSSAWSKREEFFSDRGISTEDKWVAEHTNDAGTSMDIEIDLCGREQCINNDGQDWGNEFFIGEIVFATWFVFELLLRLYSARSYKTYISTCSNIFDVFAVFISVGEAVYLPIILGGPMYEVWGNPWGDPSTMRFFRLLVTIRFITMQRHFSGLKVIKMTVKKVAGKMKIPIFFFFVFAVVFASFFYIIESGELFIDCNVGDYNPENTMAKEVEKCMAKDPKLSRMDCIDVYNQDWGTCRSCPEPAVVLGPSTDYNNEFKYNGTCKNFIVVQGENGQRLEEPKILDMLDAIWTMIVTMTTVGYGGFFPLQPLGKIVALVAALFGSFYMAMPLTIVGSKFYEIYEDVQDEDEVLASEMEKIFKKKIVVKKQPNALEMTLSVAQLSRLKLKSLSAKDRVREMGLHKDEVEMAFDYISAVDQLPSDHSMALIRDFAARHFTMMKLMSKHLIHRKKTLSSHDFDGPALLNK